MTDRFESARLKLKRARKHTDDLEAEISAFWATEPYEVEMLGTRESGPGCYRVTRMHALPESIALITGDAAHNIRSALDHFACAVVPRPDRATAFPVWSTAKGTAPTAAQWRNKVDRALGGASPSLIRALMRLEVWETGRDSLLWAVHELDRVDKHRLLISIATVNTGIGLHGDSYALTTVRKFSGFAPDQPLLLERAGWTPLAQGAILLNLEDGLDLDATQATFTFDVTLGEPELLRGQPAVAQLRSLAQLSENLIRELTPLT
jgi:hypothetical protein